MHAGGLDTGQARHSARQLAFKAAAVASRFHELTGAQALILVEDFKADVAIVLRHASCGQCQTRSGEVFGLDQQRAGIGFDVVADVGGRQRIHHLLGVHAGQAADQRAVVRLLRPQHDREANGHAGGQPDQQTYLAEHRHLGDVIQEIQTRQGVLAPSCGACFRGYVIHCFGHDSIRPQTGICMMSW